jgi:hypothetical protein
MPRVRGPRNPSRTAAISSAQTSSATAYDLAALWDQEYPRFRQSRRRIAEAGRLRRGEIKPHVPSDIDNADAFRIVIPHATMLGQSIIQYLTRKSPSVQRDSGPGPMAQRVASKIEHYLGQPGRGGLLAEIRANGEQLWESFVAHGANDGEYGLLVMPRPAHWSHIVDFADDDPEQPNGTPRIHPYFLRDVENRTPKDAYYSDAESPREFQLDDRNTADAYYEYVRDARARSAPFVVEVLPHDTCLPIGLDPSTGRVDAMLVRTVRSALSLKALGFDWQVLGHEDAPRDESGALSPTSVLLGGGTEMSLYALWVPGGVWYQVGPVPGRGNQRKGYRTYMVDGEGRSAAAFINLREQYGIDDVPGGYFYGAHHANERDPDKKGIPLLWTFGSLINGVNQTISSIVHHSYEVGFGGWFADPTGIDTKLWTQNGQPISVKVQRGKVTYVAGKLTPAVHTGVDKDVGWFVQMALNLLERFGPSPAMTGGAADAGGFSQAVGMAAGENTIAQILNGAMQALTVTCECLLEQTECLSRHLDGDGIPVYARVDPKTGQRHNLLELTANDINGDYRVEVIFPMKKGSNLALAQGMFQWWKGGGISHYTWLQDGWGEEQPEEEQDRIRVEQALNSDKGQELIWTLAARIQGDREMAKIAQLQQAGKLAPGGTPNALMPPRPGGAPGTGTGMPAAGEAGVAVGNVGASALGGVMSGAMQTGPQAQVAQATGASAPTVTPQLGP